MFASGSANLEPYFEDILLAMADTIKAVPNKISISGHTDAKPFVGRGDFGNWELSANRANAARRALVFGSYPDDQVARVVGYASSALFDREHPLNPVNRRIDIIVLTKKAQRSIEGDSEDGAEPEAGGEPSVSSASTPAVAPPSMRDARAVLPAATGAPVQDAELRQRLNIFEDGTLKLDRPPADQ